MRAIRTGRGSWIPSEMRWLSRQIRPFLRWHIASFVCISAASFLSLLAPLVLKWLIDVIVPGRRIGPLIGAVGLIFLCHQGKAVLSSIAGYLTMGAAQGLALQLRLCLVRHLDTLSADYHESTPVGASMYPLKEPIDEISYFGSDLLPAILRTLMATMLTLGTMLILNARMTLAILPIIPVFLLTRNYFRDRLEDNSDTVQQDQGTWSSFLYEHLSSIIAIQLLRKEYRRERAAFRLLGERARSVSRLFRTGISFTFYTSLTIALAMSAVIGYGGWSVFAGTLTIGGLIAFYTYLTQLFEPLSGAAETYVRAKKTFASIRQVQTVFALKPAIVNSRSPIKFPQGRTCEIEVRDLLFAYPGGRGALAIPYLHIRPGEHVAIVGENGAGKSTLAKLLARLYDVSSGSICVAGCDLREIEIDSFREHVCYAPPQPILFDTTVASNLRLGKMTASDRELQKVMECVGLKDWVDTLQGGLNQQISPGGSRLSGGQRQRIGIARSILLQPRILILDEASSSLDAGSEQRLLSNLGQILPGSTIIVISHRLSALSCVGRVVLLESGSIVGDDSPRTLLGCSHVYSQLFPDLQKTSPPSAFIPKE